MLGSSTPQKRGLVVHYVNESINNGLSNSALVFELTAYTRVFITPKDSSPKELG
jgi:hypothetical protein